MIGAPSIGAVIGKYQLQAELGSGGMGTVWLAHHLELGWRVAVKILHAQFHESDDIVQRFFNEARAAGAVKDAGIVEIFDFGFTPEGSAYIVMELLDGESLEQRLRRVGKLPVDDALRAMHQVAASLGAAHARGIVHRDLKPDNVFLARDASGAERPKILDFGIAKLEWISNVKTRTAAVMGTPMYMSPEQCRGATDLDQRSDVYALGCLLFALLAGYPPFYAEGPGQVFLMHLQMPPPTVASRGVAVPLEVEALIARCLAKSAAERFPSGTEVAAAIGAIVGPVAAPAAPTAAPIQVTRAAENVVLPTPHATENRAFVVKAIALLVVLAAILVAIGLAS